jgi:hypothetical protein
MYTSMFIACVYVIYDVYTQYIVHIYIRAPLHLKGDKVAKLPIEQKNEISPTKNRRNLPIWMSEWRSRVGKP